MHDAYFSNYFCFQKSQIIITSPVRGNSTTDKKQKSRRTLYFVMVFIKYFYHKKVVALSDGPFDQNRHVQWGSKGKMQKS